jgi:2-dehydro-3-deoxyphosphooctonate aldolase (KDO 8-P synthase)
VTSEGIDRVFRSGKLFLIAGPCVIESEEHTMRLCAALRDLCAELSIPFVFKASYDKANRSSGDSYRGPGPEAGERILRRVREENGVAISSDVHDPGQAKRFGRFLDVVQVPAFLCRQTDLLVAAAKTGRWVNVKKGQFLAPWDMSGPVRKLESAGCRRILLTERGTMFGYNRLVNDMRALPEMKKLGHPVVYDATHSVQLPGAAGEKSGGEREFVEPLALAATAAGADGIFLEVHDRPKRAKSDAATVYPLGKLRALLLRLLAVRDAVADRSPARWRR